MPRRVTKLNQLLREYQTLPEFLGIDLKFVNQKGGFKSTPLHIAIYREKPDEVRILLRAKADPNAPGEYGERPLQVAVNCGNDQIIEQLLLAGALCGLRDDKGMDAWQTAEAVGFQERLAKIVRRIAPSQLRRA